MKGHVPLKRSNTIMNGEFPLIRRAVSRNVNNRQAVQLSNTSQTLQKVIQSARCIIVRGKDTARPESTSQYHNATTEILSRRRTARSQPPVIDCTTSASPDRTREPCKLAMPVCWQNTSRLAVSPGRVLVFFALL